MRYRLDYRRDAQAALKAMSKDVAQRVIRKIKRMCDDLAGDVKRLTEMSPAYRLRVGDWRVLFDVEGDTIVVHDVKHRSKAYER
jgi:mRNA interferase RelE/StbE